MPELQVDRAGFSAYWTNRNRRQKRHRNEQLIANSEFATDLTGWTSLPAGTGAEATWDTGRAKVARIDSTNHSRLVCTITCEVGERYEIDVVANGPAGLFVKIGTSQAGNQTLTDQGVAASGRGVFQFVATQTTHHVTIRGRTNNTDSFIESAHVRKVV